MLSTKHAKSWLSHGQIRRGFFFTVLPGTVPGGTVHYFDLDYLPGPETYVHAGQTFYNAYIDFKEEKGEILNINTLVKARGRKPSKNKTLELKKNKGKEKENCEEKEENLDFEILNINGELYLMNNQKEVMSLSGSYIGWYRDGGIV